MPGVTSVAFLSLRAWFKKSGKCSQSVELKSKEMVTTQQEKSSEGLWINSANNSGPLFKQKCLHIAEGLSLKRHNDSTMNTDPNIVKYIEEYKVPSEVDVNHIKGNDEVVCLEVPRQGGEIHNETIHAIETSMKNMELKMASLAEIQMAVRKLSWEMKFVKSELKKK